MVTQQAADQLVQWHQSFRKSLSIDDRGWLDLSKEVSDLADNYRMPLRHKWQGYLMAMTEMHNWRSSLIDALAEHCIDAPLSDTPKEILAKVLTAANDITRLALQDEPYMKLARFGARVMRAHMVLGKLDGAELIEVMLASGMTIEDSSNRLSYAPHLGPTIKELTK